MTSEVIYGLIWKLFVHIGVFGAAVCFCISILIVGYLLDLIMTNLEGEHHDE